MELNSAFMKPKIISVSSDFAVQSRGLGMMEAIAYSLSPEIKYINLIHGLSSYQIAPAAQALEAVVCLPIGCHVCIVDPTVGSARRGIILTTKRGDFLIGPDNGVLISAARVLGGIINCNVIENPQYMLHPISDIFHGRDIFVPAAAHLSNGVPPDRFGDYVKPESLMQSPFEEAFEKNGFIVSMVININHFGAAILNVSHSAWDSFAPPIGSYVLLERPGRMPIAAKHGKTFSDVQKGKCVILRDECTRIEVALNLSDFSETFGITQGDVLVIKPSQYQNQEKILEGENEKY